MKIGYTLRDEKRRKEIIQIFTVGIDRRRWKWGKCEDLAVDFMKFKLKIQKDDFCGRFYLEILTRDH